MALGMADMLGSVHFSASLEHCAAHHPCPSQSWAPLPTQTLCELRLLAG